MTAAATLTRPAPTLQLDVLKAELLYLERTIPDLRARTLAAEGRRAFDLGRWLYSAVATRAAVEAEIAAMEVSSCR